MRNGYVGTYRGLSVIPVTSSKAKPLENPVWEHFAEMVVMGKSYVDAYEMSHDTAAQSKGRRYSSAKSLAQHPEVVRRIAQLRKPIIDKAKRKFEYTLEQAMEECDQAHQLAELQAAPDKMMKAIELKAKLMRMLVTVSETRTSPLDGVSTEELVELLRFAKEMKEREIKTIAVGGGLVVEPERGGGVVVGGELSEVAVR